MQTINDEEEHLQGLREANALSTYAQRTLCTSAQCALCFIPEWLPWRVLASTGQVLCSTHFFAGTIGTVCSTHGYYRVL